MALVNKPDRFIVENRVKVDYNLYQFLKADRNTSYEELTQKASKKVIETHTDQGGKGGKVRK